MRAGRFGLSAGGLGLWMLWAGCADGAKGGSPSGVMGIPGGGHDDAGGAGAGSGGTGTGAGAAASGSSGTGGSDGGGSAADGGAAGSTGSAGSASAGTGGAAGSDSDEDAGAVACAHQGEPLLDPAGLPSCESATCSNAHCLPARILTPQQAEALADCDATNKCVPDLFIETFGNFLLDGCRSLGGAEGRCLSTCVPQVAEQLDVLPQDVCDEGQRCAPCSDPLSGAETSACSQSCDTGPAEDPYTFPGCCGELGVCVPDALVPEDQRALLGGEGCSGDGVLCAPRAMAEDRTAVPASCTSLLSAEGRCLPACLPALAAQADRLPQDGCADGELCAPCFDPLSGSATGACEIAGDEPVEEPVTFADCCGGASACVPQALVPAEQQSLLDAGGCASGELCAPRDLAAGQYAPQTCASWGGAEGRCLLECLPDVAAQRERLTRGACDTGELCVPCYDPLSGDATGACEIEGDQPEDQPPYVFPTCCDDGAGHDLGTCVPGALVPEAQQSLLGADVCGDTGFLCAPTPLATDSYEPEACASWLSAEGRCLPACLPDVDAQQAQLRRAACGTGELCVPCYDPLSSASTGACEIDGDIPEDDPVTFPSCCPTNGVNRGRCVPEQAAGSQADALPVLNCEALTGDADAYVCAPNEKIANPDHQFPSCTTSCGADPLSITCVLGLIGGAFGQPGACVPACLLSEQSTTLGNAATVFGQSTCATGEDCAPCVNPETDAPTGLCD